MSQDDKQYPGITQAMQDNAKAIWLEYLDKPRTSIMELLVEVYETWKRLDPHQAAILGAPTVKPSPLAEALRAEVLRLVDALVYAHDAGFQWPDDPLPSGSVAHNLFIERGNDPEHIAVRERNGK